MNFMNRIKHVSAANLLTQDKETAKGSHTVPLQGETEFGKTHITSVPLGVQNTTQFSSHKDIDDNGTGKLVLYYQNKE